MAMREDILAIVDAAARRLLAARTAEAAAVGAVAGGLCAAAGEAAWTVGRLYPAVAAAMCAVPLVFAGLLAGWPGLRRALALKALSAAIVGGGFGLAGGGGGGGGGAGGGA